MKKMWLQVGALVLLCVMLSSCGKKDEAPETVEQGIPVEVQTVSLGAISTENKLSGTVVSGKTEQVYVSLSARCSETFVEVGDSVKAGQLLCKLDLKSFQDNYEIAELSYQTAKKNFEDQAKLLDQQIEQQEKNYNNTLALFQMGAASQMEVDTAKLGLDAARVNRSSSLSQLELAVKNAQKGMDQITDTLKNVDANGGIPSPVNGTVVSLSVGKDSYVSAGMPIAVVESSDSMKISVSVSESLIGKLQVGGRAHVKLSALNQSFDTTISDIAKTVNPANRLYTVQLTVPKEVSGLLSGMFADVSLYTDSRENAVIVPTESLLLQADGQFVVLLDEKQTARRVLVQTGLIGDGMTEITSGLSGGDTLVTVGQSYLKDGDVARIVPTQE